MYAKDHLSHSAVLTVLCRCRDLTEGLSNPYRRTSCKGGPGSLQDRLHCALSPEPKVL